MTLRPDNLALLARSIARGRELAARDRDVAAATPDLATFRRIVERGTSLEIVERALAEYGDRPALGELAGESPTISYHQLWQQIGRVASGLATAVATGEFVVLIGSPTIDHVVAELACHYLGAVSVPLARTVGEAELAAIISQCEATAVCCTVGQLARLVPVMIANPTIGAVIALDVRDGDDAQADALAGVRRALAAAPRPIALISLGELATCGKGRMIGPVIPSAGADPLVTLIYTSGSTGAPKGAMLHERGWRARWATLPFDELTALPMVSVVFLPQHHMGGRNAVANSLKLGGLAWFTRDPEMATLWDDIRAVRPTYLHLVPRLAEAIYRDYQRAATADSPDRVRADMRARWLGDRLLLAVTASAPMPPEVASFIKQCFEIPIVDVFAGTEYGQLFVDGRVNRSNVRALKLVDVPELGYLTSDTPFPRGELRVQTARACTRYFKNEPASQALVDGDGFVCTGDIFEQRPDEMVWIDRKNNVVKLAQGEFVNLWRIEAAIATASPSIHQIYIHGDGTRPYLLAVIVPDPALAGVPDGELARRLRSELAAVAREHGLQSFECPRDFVIERTPFSRDNGLLTGLGKPARPKLAAAYAAQLAALAPATTDDPAECDARGVIAAALAIDASRLDLALGFRDYGGDSIAAANLCAQLVRRFGVGITVGDIVAPTATLASLCARIEAGGHRGQSGDRFARVHGDAATAIRAADLTVERVLDEALDDVLSRDARQPASGDDVLLTGATGYLGRFLCISLLERARDTDTTVWCIVRASDDAAAAARLDAAYQPGSPLHRRFRALAEGRLRVVAGDLERPQFGWPADRYREAATAVARVIHAAANVNHAVGYRALFGSNVVATAEVARFAIARRTKRLSYISTNSVTLALLGERQRACEDDDTRSLGDGWVVESGAARHADGYRASKWAGEVVVHDAAERYGVAVDVFRCNIVLPPARWRGVVHRDDFVTRLVRSVIATGLAPGSFYDDAAAGHLDGLPVDFIADAVAAITAFPAPPAGRPVVYHVTNPADGGSLSLDTVIDRVAAAGYPVERIADHATWVARFTDKLRAAPAAARDQSSLAIVAQWQAPIVAAPRRRVDAARFRGAVRAVRPRDHGELPRLDVAYLDRFIADLRTLGLAGLAGLAGGGRDDAGPRSPSSVAAVMKASLLTADERDDMVRCKGYLVVPDALSPDTVERVRAAIDRVAAASEERASAGRPAAAGRAINLADILGLDDAFLDLVDCPRVLPKIWGLLGWNIWVQHSHLVVTPPLATAATVPGVPFEYGWHRDGGAINRDVANAPPLLVKVGFYLSDVTLDGGPTLMLDDADPNAAIPPSHVLPPNARPLAVAAGTAVLFTNRSIHSLRSPNTSPRTRHAVFLQYGYRWIQPLDRSSVAHLADRVDGVRAQLLGLTTTYTTAAYKGSEGRSGRFVPADEDVPLVGFLRGLLGPDADRYVARSVAPSELRFTSY